MKRRRSETEDDAPPLLKPSGTKRQRTGSKRNLLDISDEILLRILSYLPVQRLAITERVSRKLRRLASDGAVWRLKYLERWISPRARRMPPGTISTKTMVSKLVSWFEHGQSLRDGRQTDWKRQFKLRNNWDKGSAKLHEVELAKPPTPPVVAKVHCGLIFTVDAQSGLRVWSQAKPSKRLISQMALKDGIRPTTIAVGGEPGRVCIFVGFYDGGFEVYTLLDKTGLMQLATHKRGEDEGPVTAAALAPPYIVVMTDDRHTRLYHISNQVEGTASSLITSLATLHANAALCAASLSLRRTQKAVVATICYAFDRLNDGWCLGLQEITISNDNGSTDSRITSTIDSPLEAHYVGPKTWDLTSRSASSTPLTTPLTMQPHMKRPPSSISYAHPYLIASLPDNSLMSYIVTSDDQKLEISSGKRLYGHTSSANAEVSSRGKAVSVSVKGDDIRVWELEDVLTTFGRGRPSTQIKAQHAAIEVASAIARRGTGLGLALNDMKKELALVRRSVGFDDEQVVVLGNRHDTQILACYDFT